MATIIGGIGTSHVPTIAVTYDKGRHTEPAWAPLFEGYKPVAKWLEEQKPDVLLVFYNDHANSFFFDFYPTFALGAGPCMLIERQQHAGVLPRWRRRALQHLSAKYNVIGFPCGNTGMQCGAWVRKELRI